jgi:hypothetical protein
MPYRRYQSTSLSEFMGDFVVYRNLVPMDKRLPGIDALGDPIGRRGNALPRKAEQAYGEVVAHMLQAARSLDHPSVRIRQLVYIGDTQMNDGTAFRNICAAGRWPGWAFIGRDEMMSPPRIEIQDSLYIANRWSALETFASFLEEHGLGPSKDTVLVIDVDKTALGPRGRNDKVIDAARVEGVQITVSDLLGSDFDEPTFRTAYDELNKPVYHAFTGDNQDYLAYICLVLGAGLFSLDSLLGQVRTGSLTSFAGFIAKVQERRDELSASGLTPVHDDVWRCVQAGDPTPFKAFRYNEYSTTIARFGDLPGASIDSVLSQRITINQEVRQLALAFRAGGSVVFGVSDKPDEASLPNHDQALAGKKPLHRMETVAAGEE